MLTEVKHGHSKKAAKLQQKSTPQTVMTSSMDESGAPPRRPSMSTGTSLWFSAQFALWEMTTGELLELVAACSQERRPPRPALWNLRFFCTASLWHSDEELNLRHHLTVDRQDLLEHELHDHRDVHNLSRRRTTQPCRVFVYRPSESLMEGPTGRRMCLASTSGRPLALRPGPIRSHQHRGQTTAGRCEAAGARSEEHDEETHGTSTNWSTICVAARTAPEGRAGHLDHLLEH